jgi:hypothetical protein
MKGNQMNKRLIIAIAALAGVFGIAIAGASVLNLSGSDRAPGAGTTDANCAGNLVIQAPVKEGGPNNKRIVNVYVKGDMTACEGETIRLEADVDGSPVYAIRTIGVDSNEEVFTFNTTTGDFTNAAPTVVDGQLVQAGTLVGPYKAAQFGLIDVLIATSFE